MDLIIETERLLMREILPTDAEALFDMDKNPEVHKYLWQKPIVSIEEVHDYIKMIRKQYEVNWLGRTKICKRSCRKRKHQFL
jgi:[ribosomal protein S5]-alanine N-acetyltransferase